MLHFTLCQGNKKCQNTFKTNFSANLEMTYLSAVGQALKMLEEEQVTDHFSVTYTLFWRTSARIDTS